MRFVRVLAPFCAVAVLASGCSMEDLLGEPVPESNPSDGPSEERCDSLLANPTGESEITTATVLLMDGSASSLVNADQPESRQDWATMLSEKLPENGNDLVVIGLFGGAVDWKSEKVTAGKSNDANRTRNDMNDTRECLVADLSDAISSPPPKPQTDVLRALADAADYVRDRSGPKTIYIATDGLSNTGCADLRAAAIGDPTAIPHIVESCGSELPRLDDSYTIQFLGIGYPADGWSDVKPSQRTWMRDLWSALCEETGANCTEPGSAAPSRTDAASIAPEDEANVAMPEIILTPGNPTLINVPASVLFNIDEHSIAGDRTQEDLREIVDFLNGFDYTKIEISGHTDSTGTPERNEALSELRAEAVADYLTGQGFTNITTEGYASTRPACEPEFANGKPDLLNMACNRRVEILVYT